MLNIIISGVGGRLGSAICRKISESDDMRVIAGIDISPSVATADFPVYHDINEYTGKADAIIDCSHHSAVTNILSYAREKKIPTVIATTGHTDDERKLIRDAAADIAIMNPRNMSVGINLLLSLVYEAAKALGSDYDCEIVEAHHAKKLDAPSGTALMLADSIKEAMGEDTVYTLERHTRRAERPENEIGISSIRGGTIVGEHEVIFAGDNEVIKISHSAQSRDVFADGAVRAARFISKAAPGFYTMSDVLK